MAIYCILRVRTTESPEAYSAIEKRRLRESIGAAPGVIVVADIMTHPKGGYLVSFSHDEKASGILDFVRAAGYTVW